MCRFVLIKSNKLIKPQLILEKFALMAKNSPAYDGDWQGDGWGISILTENNIWLTNKSLNPIWKDQQVFDSFPQTTTFIIHARSASFEHHKGEIEYNQPYVEEPYAFVFNGLLKKVMFKQKIPGKIGAQKLFYLLNELLKKYKSADTHFVRLGMSPDLIGKGTHSEQKNVYQAIEAFEQLLRANVGEIQACNIGLANKNNLYALNLFSKHPEYYRLHYLDTPDLKIISSGPLEKMNLKPLTSKTIIL